VSRDPTGHEEYSRMSTSTRNVQAVCRNKGGGVDKARSLAGLRAEGWDGGRRPVTPRVSG
jgi:hypothetical protein